MGNSWPITWWTFTGEYTPFIDGISSPIMANRETGGRISQRHLPFGACYVANMDPHTLEIRPSRFAGADGLSIICITPRTTPPVETDKGSWYIDSRANNCTMKTDDVHRCWVRHGTVGDKLQVDKAGNTCAAGAGSIQNAGWHGFLHNGILHE